MKQLLWLCLLSIFCLPSIAMHRKIVVRRVQTKAGKERVVPVDYSALINDRIDEISMRSKSCTPEMSFVNASNKERVFCTILALYSIALTGIVDSNCVLSRMILRFLADMGTSTIFPAVYDKLTVLGLTDPDALALIARLIEVAPADEVIKVLLTTVEYGADQEIVWFGPGSDSIKTSMSVEPVIDESFRVRFKRETCAEVGGFDPVLCAAARARVLNVFGRASR